MQGMEVTVRKWKSGYLRPRNLMLALEPRIMFDASPSVDLSPKTGIVEPQSISVPLASDATEIPAQDAVANSSQQSVIEAEEIQFEAVATNSQIVFIDSTLKDARTIGGEIDKNITVVYLDSDDPWVSMTKSLIDAGSVSTVHIISHGNQNSLIIGRQIYGVAELSARTELLESWRLYLAPDADILLYGCELGSNAESANLLSVLAETTGADIAASIDRTGPTAIGGNLTLERSTGVIETATLELTGLSQPLSVNILYGTGHGVNPTTAVRRDPYWDVVAFPAIVNGAYSGFSVPYDGYNPLTSSLPGTYYARNGYDAGGGITNYWMGPNSTAGSLVTGSSTLSSNYNWTPPRTDFREVGKA